MFNRIRQLSQLVTYRELRNGILGLAVVIGGLGLALLTLYAHFLGDRRMAGFAAAASLVFVLLIIVFVIPPLAKNASAEASQLNLPFEFTTGGAIFIGLLTIVGFAAWNTANNLLFLVLAFIIAALVVGFVAGHIGLKRLDVKMRFPETVHANEPTPIVVSLHSRKRLLPTFSVTAEVRGRRTIPDDLRQRLNEFLPESWAARIAKPPLVKHTLDYFLHVPRSGALESRHEHIFERRGRFEIEDFELSTRFPFALFRHRRRLPAQRAEIVVFPELEEIETEILRVSEDEGHSVSKKKGMGRDLLGLREYQPLDDLRYIDWKATARTTRMIVRDFAAEDELRVVVILDTRIVKSEAEKSIPLRKQIENAQRGIVEGESHERIESAVKRASFLLSHFHEIGAELCLITPEDRTELATGQHQFLLCMRLAASVLPIHVTEYVPTDFEDEVIKAAESIVDSKVFLFRARESRLTHESLKGIRVINF